MRRRALSADHVGLDIQKHRAGNVVVAALGLVVQHVDAVELRVVVAAVLAVAADAVLVAQHLLKLGAHQVTSLARLHVRNLARKRSLGGGKRAGEIGREERRNARNSAWQFGTGLFRYGLTLPACLVAARRAASFSARFFSFSSATSSSVIFAARAASRISF